MEVEKEFLLQFFEYSHLPPDLQKTSQYFCELAYYVVSILPKNPERTMTLRKLLEAKDCAIGEIIKRQLADDKKPYCHGLDICICHVGYIEPDDYCPFHGGMHENNRCVKCGRFFKRENPGTCPASINT